MMHRERIGLRDSDSVASFIAGVAGILVFGTVFTLLSLYLQMFSVLLNALISLAFMLLCSSLIFRGYKRTEMKRRTKASKEYREMMNAEKQRLIDEMLRDNSNIPIVEKSE